MKRDYRVYIDDILMAIDKIEKKSLPKLKTQINEVLEKMNGESKN